jgi:hypothetical protein
VINVTSAGVWVMKIVATGTVITGTVTIVTRIHVTAGMPLATMIAGTGGKQITGWTDI